jgi:predicted phosphohydrolase
MFQTTEQAKQAAVARFGLRRHFVVSPASEILTMLGYPGYDEDFAEEALVEMAETGKSPREALDHLHQLIAVAARHGAGY